MSKETGDGKKKTRNRRKDDNGWETEKRRRATASVVDLFPENAERDKDHRNVPPGGNADPVEDARKRVRVNLGKRWSELHERVKAGEFTWEEFVDGLDPEELVRGQLKDKDGTFRGRPPKIVPRAFHQACIRELRKRFDQKLQVNLLDATEELIRLGKDETVDAATRAKVLKYVIERVMGKIPDRVEIATADPWETIIDGIVNDIEDEKVGRAQDYLSRTPGK